MNTAGAHPTVLKLNKNNNHVNETHKHRVSCSLYVPTNYDSKVRRTIITQYNNNNHLSVLCEVHKVHLLLYHHQVIFLLLLLHGRRHSLKLFYRKR